jgi:hypothetical protein
MTCPDSLADRLMERKREQQEALSTSKTTPATSSAAASGATSAPSANAEPSSDLTLIDPPTSAPCAVRVCKNCNEEKPLTIEFFHANGCNRSGEPWFKRMCRACYREVERRRKDEIRKDPVRRQREWLMTRARDQRKAKRRKRARRLAAVGLDLPDDDQLSVNAEGFSSLYSRPLAAAIDRMRVARQIPNVDKFCTQLGVAPRTVSRWRDGELTTVNFDLADQIVSRLGLLWFDVWQECPGDRQHLDDVAAHGECARCEAHCDAEDAFTPSSLRGDRRGQLTLEAA